VLCYCHMCRAHMGFDSGLTRECGMSFHCVLCTYDNSHSYNIMHEYEHFIVCSAHMTTHTNISSHTLTHEREISWKEPFRIKHIDYRCVSNLSKDTSICQKRHMERASWNEAYIYCRCVSNLLTSRASKETLI